MGHNLIIQFTRNEAETLTQYMSYEGKISVVVVIIVVVMAALCIRNIIIIETDTKIGFFHLLNYFASTASTGEGFEIFRVYVLWRRQCTPNDIANWPKPMHMFCASSLRKERNKFRTQARPCTLSSHSCTPRNENDGRRDRFCLRSRRKFLISMAFMCAHVDLDRLPSPNYHYDCLPQPDWKATT